METISIGQIKRKFSHQMTRKANEGDDNPACAAEESEDRERVAAHTSDGRHARFTGED
jgi:hypothetical protein